MRMGNGQITGSEAQATIGRRAAFWRKLLTDLAIMTVIGAFLAIIGPFGTIDQPLAVRLISWLALSYLGYATYAPMGFLVDRAHVALALPKAPLWLAAVLVGTVPMTAMLHVIDSMPQWPRMPSLDQVTASYFYVFVIGGGVTLLFNVIGSRQPTRATHAQTAPPPGPGSAKSPPVAPISNPLIDQLPAELGSDILALEMEDHYVRVHTTLGSELVLMRLRDAMAHVADLDGRQVHRSWWVARGAVDDVQREGRNVRLILPRGLEAPVARAQVSELKQAGWI